MPERFYFEVESIGNLEPDAIIQQGIKVLQQKLAAVIQDLSDTNGQAAVNGDYDAPRSPDVANGQPWQEQGYTTPYANGGGASAWGGGAGAATPYGATPYGQNGTNGWS